MCCEARCAGCDAAVGGWVLAVGSAADLHLVGKVWLCSCRASWDPLSAGHVVPAGSGKADDALSQRGTSQKRRRLSGAGAKSATPGGSAPAKVRSQRRKTPRASSSKKPRARPKPAVQVEREGDSDSDSDFATVRRRSSSYKRRGGEREERREDD